MVKCDGVTDGYTKYVHFVHPLDIRDGSWTWKMPSSAGGGQSFAKTQRTIFTVSKQHAGQTGGCTALMSARLT